MRFDPRSNSLNYSTEEIKTISIKLEKIIKLGIKANSPDIRIEARECLDLMGIERNPQNGGES